MNQLSHLDRRRADSAWRVDVIATLRYFLAVQWIFFGAQYFLWAAFTFYIVLRWTCEVNGEIRFDGHTVAGLKSPEIAALGLARTFQNVQLFGELTVLENVLVGLHHTYRSGSFGVAAGLPRARREEAAATAAGNGIARVRRAATSCRRGGRQPRR